MNEGGELTKLCVVFKQLNKLLLVQGKVPTQGNKLQLP